MPEPQSAVPPPVPLQMSSTTSAPTKESPSPIPSRSKDSDTPSPATEPHKKPVLKVHPVLRLKIRDLSSQGTRDFLEAVKPGYVVEEAVQTVLRLLYTPSSNIPGTRSVTLVLRPMEGVAYTIGRDFDTDHKEIHFSTDYIKQITRKRKGPEITGVLVHEMVHAWQWNAFGTAPGGLIEGIADWVRLHAGYAPPHWTKEGGGDWDAGYQHTGYFLDYLEQKYGKGSVTTINERLRNKKYHEETFWKELFGHKVEKLWSDYQKTLETDKSKQEVDNGNQETATKKSGHAHESELTQSKNKDHRKIEDEDEEEPVLVEMEDHTKDANLAEHVKGGNSASESKASQKTKK
ncbi:MAG: hypothetical protein M1835_004550 [Candelina submexicana]|nr:MAG: hypothetical protein M1835_004550 [Candelina submexicana]